MSDTLRSINITHKKAPNLTFRVGIHAPHQIDDAEKKSVVVEIHARDKSGYTDVVASLLLDEFIELARDVASVGKSVAPAQQHEPVS